MEQGSSSFVSLRIRYARSAHDHVGVSVWHFIFSVLKAKFGMTFFSFYLFILKLNDYGPQVETSCFFFYLFFWGGGESG